jgi:hypothetical protein
MLGAWKLVQAGSSLSADGMQPDLHPEVYQKRIVIGSRDSEIIENSQTFMVPTLRSESVPKLNGGLANSDGWWPTQPEFLSFHLGACFREGPGSGMAALSNSDGCRPLQLFIYDASGFTMKGATVIKNEFTKNRRFRMDSWCAAGLVVIEPRCANLRTRYATNLALCFGLCAGELLKVFAKGLR